jgi:hypothetical protein
MKMQNAIGEMGEGFKPRAKPDTKTEVLPGIDRAHWGWCV